VSEKWPIQVSVISSFVLDLTVIGTIAFSAFFFFPLQSPLSSKEDNNGIIASAASVPWVEAGMGFLIPYPLATGALGDHLICHFLSA